MYFIRRGLALLTLALLRRPRRDTRPAHIGTTAKTPARHKNKLFFMFGSAASVEAFKRQDATLEQV